MSVRNDMEALLERVVMDQRLPSTMELRWNKMKPAERIKLLKKIGADKMKYGRDMESLSNRKFREMGPKYTKPLEALKEGAYDRWALKPTDSNDLYLLKSIVNYLAPKMPKKSAEEKWRKMSPKKRAKLLAKAKIKAKK